MDLQVVPQLYLVNAGEELELYVSPANWRPDAPPAPMSSPPSFTILSNKPLRPGAMVDIIDIAPTVLKYFAVPIPSDIDGKPLF
jgi:hypothetical protein